MKDKKTDKRRPAPERREIILDAALHTFLELGYYDAHMVTIAERADVTKPILYRHFPGKLDLLLAILDRAGRDLRNSLLETAGEEIDWRTSIKNDIRSYLDFVENYRAGYRLLLSIDPHVDREVERLIDGIRLDVMNIIAERIEVYADTAMTPPEDIEVTATLLVGMTETAALHWISNEKFPRAVYENNLVRSITSILAALPPRPR